MVAFSLFSGRSEGVKEWCSDSRRGVDSGQRKVKDEFVGRGSLGKQRNDLNGGT